MDKFDLNTIVKNRTWKKFVMPWGKHKGWTLFQIYVNDFSYLRWLQDKDIKREPIKTYVDAAIIHKQNVDPYSWEL